MIAAIGGSPEDRGRGQAAYHRGRLGKTGGDVLALDDKDSVKIAALKDGFESWFPNYMSGEEIPVTN